ncbi:MAG: DUF4912 domain-containing protein [Solirubrobacteraceae bacterium]
MNPEPLANQSSGRRTDSSEPGDADDASLPVSYGTDTLVFMARDPTFAQAYWDIGDARIKDAVDSLGGGKAILRLIGLPIGQLLAEYEVCAKHGSYGVALPEADRSYAAELAIVRYYRKIVLARSKIVRTPPSRPRPAAAPVFVSREEQRRALELGLILERRGGESSALSAVSSCGLSATNTRGATITQLSSVGSEARLLGVGSERRFGSEHASPGWPRA